MILTPEELEKIAEDEAAADITSLETHEQPAIKFPARNSARVSSGRPSARTSGRLVPSAPLPAKAPSPSASRVQRAVASAPPPAPAPSPSASRVQRAVPGISKQEVAEVSSSSSKRNPATRSAKLTPQNRPPAVAATATKLERVSGSARASSREDRPASSSRREKSGRRPKQGDAMGMYLGIGIGVVILIVTGYFVFGGKPKETEKKEKGRPELVDNDKTPSYEYAQRGDDFLKKKDTRNAAIMYEKASERADKEGNLSKAKEYNMRLVSAEKASTLR